jgi:glycosyltransferase 2 family protein
MGFVSFGSVVQIPGIGGGVQVATVLVLTELFRVPIETASSFALLLWIMMFVVVVPFGAVLAVREGLNWTRLKRLRREVQL